MIDLALNLPGGRAPRLLFVGAHCDDIEIGCGATAMALVRRFPGMSVDWVVLSSEGARKEEAIAGARSVLEGAEARIAIEGFRGAYFPSELASIKDYFEKLKGMVDPDLVFAHCRDDLHQDHRVVGELVWNTFRDHMILEYEIPKYDGGLGSPALFFPIDELLVRRKVELLTRTFASQRSRRWFTASTFEALMRLRGVECNAESGYAEAFHVRKMLLGGLS